MLKKDLILRNPLHVMAYGNDDILSTGQFGAVLARAGVGKTAFLVQLSLNALLRGKNVLHISLSDPVKKVSLWYKEVFNLIAQQYQAHQINQLWESVLPNRFISVSLSLSIVTPVIHYYMGGHSFRKVH